MGHRFGNEVKQGARYCPHRLAQLLVGGLFSAQSLGVEVGQDVDLADIALLAVISDPDAESTA